MQLVPHRIHEAAIAVGGRLRAGIASTEAMRAELAELEHLVHEGIAAAGELDDVIDDLGWPPPLRAQLEAARARVALLAEGARTLAGELHSLQGVPTLDAGALLAGAMADWFLGHLASLAADVNELAAAARAHHDRVFAALWSDPAAMAAEAALDEADDGHAIAIDDLDAHLTH